MLSFFPRDVLDEIVNLIESVSEVFFFLLFNNFQAPRFSLDLLIRHRKFHKKITKTVSYSLLLADGIHPGEVLCKHWIRRIVVSILCKFCFLWHVKRCIIRYFHIIILSSLFVFKKYIFLFYQSLLLLYISLFIFNIRSFLLHIFYLYSIFCHLYFIIFITILSFYISIIYFNICILFLAIVFIDVILLFYLPLFPFYTDAIYIQYRFHFYSIR